MTRSTELTLRRAQGDPEFIKWVRVMVTHSTLLRVMVRKIEP